MPFRYFCAGCGLLLLDGDDVLEPWQVSRRLGIERCPRCGRQLPTEPRIPPVRVEIRLIRDGPPAPYCPNCAYSVYVHRGRGKIFCTLLGRYVDKFTDRLCPFYTPAEWGLGGPEGTPKGNPNRTATQTAPRLRPPQPPRTGPCQ